MTVLPKTIQIFLPDGDPRSVRLAEITSRTVQAVQVPRGVIERAADRDELRQVGVYFLFGEADEGEVPQVYIGEAEDCWVRLGQHHKDGSKDYWTQAVVVTSKTHKFDKGQGRWLEWFCTREALRAQRYRVENQCAAKEPHLTEPVKADLYDHFDTLQILVATLGFPLFQRASQPLPPVVMPEPETDDLEDDLPLGPIDPPPVTGETYVYRHKEAEATGRFTADGFVVLAGSTVRPSISKGAVGTIVERSRVRLVKNGVLVERDGALLFDRDYLFRTPSGAANVVLGRSANGWLAWSTTDGRTLDDIRKATS